ncbi:MAG: hypothetical protein MR051_00905 [Lentisphaeria bacterium]|nr:hypothetical protein [Lentisphaeria bacterium]
MKKILLLLAALPLLLAAREIDMGIFSGKVNAQKEAEGSGVVRNGVFTFTKTAEPGFLIAGSSKPLPLVPGKDYEVSCDIEVEDGTRGALMVNMPGGKRTPWPRKEMKSSGTALLRFTAREDETKLSVYFVVYGKGTVKFRDLQFSQVDPDTYNHIRTFTGRCDKHKGAEGKGEIRDGVFSITKTNDAGFIIAGNGAVLPIEPGKNYEVVCDMELEEGAVGGLMLSMPGGKRRPFPQKKLSASGRAVLRFTAREDETKLSLYLLVFDKGNVKFRNLHVRKLPPNDPARRRYDGKTLSRTWAVENAIREDFSNDGISGVAGPSTRIVSPQLNWNAAEIKAVELDASFFPESGQIEFRFTGEANGKKVSGFVPRTAVPSGERRTVTFFFGHQPAWRGRITEISFKANVHSRSEFKVYAVRALSEPNLIPNAAVSGTKPIDMIHPGAKYTLARRGRGSRAVTVKLMDADGKLLRAHTLTPGEKSLNFTAPDETVTATVEYGAGAGRPVLLCDQVPYFGNPQEVNWQAQWIWWAIADDPVGKVRFTRDFNLSAPVKRAEMRYTADDAAEVDLNGHKFGKKSLFSTCDRVDVTEMLKAGANRFVVDVDNYGSAAGLLLELYAELENGEVFTLKSDRNWRYVHGDKTGPAVELATPPHGIWGDRVDCAYIGPRISSELRDFSETGFAVKPSAAVPDYGQVTVEVVSDTGDARKLGVEITPRSGEWKQGEWNDVKLHFNPELTAGMKGKDFTVRLIPEYFSVPGEVSCAMTPRKVERAEFPTVRLVGAGTRPYFEVDGRKLAPFYFDLPGSFVGAPMQKAHFVANAARAGSNIVRTWAALRDFWKGPDEFDFSTLDFALATIRANMPDAHVILTFKTYMPDWWLDANPGDRIKWFREHRLYHNYYQTLGSEKWVRDAQIGIKALIEHLRATGDAKYVIGIAFADGQTSEWIWASHPYGGKVPFIHHGDSEADHAAFAKFVNAKYNGRPPYAPQVPRPETWNVRDEGIFLDPDKSRVLSDWWDFRSACCSKAIRTFAALVKKETGRRIMSGAYYGYHDMLSGMFHNWQPGGHLRLHEVVSSGDCELFFAPTVYNNRFPGDPDGIMQPPEAITLNGGIPIMEFDYRTYTEYMPNQARNGGADTPAMTLSLLDKGFGLALTRGAGGHWMELHERWFREPLQYKHVGKLLKLYRSLPEKPAGTVVPDVCFVNDEKAVLRTTNGVGDSVYRALLREMFRVVPYSGASCRQVLLSDLLTPGKVPAHKFYVFLDLFELDDAQRAALKRRLADENAHGLWFYAPGVLKPGKKVDLSGITEMTGIPVERIDASWRVDWASTKEFGGGLHPAYLTTGLNFRPTGGDVIVAKSGKNLAVVGRRDGTRTDYFSAALVPETRALQEMFRRAGVRLYQRGTDVVHAGNDFVILHAVTGGRKELLVPEGMVAEQILGPKVKFAPDAPEWTAQPGMTYGFILKKKD